VTDLRSHSVALAAMAVILPVVSLLALSQEKKEFRYALGSKAIIAITNNYGSITVNPSGSSEVVITAVSRSDAITFENEQHGNRIDLRVSSRRQVGQSRRLHSVDTRRCFCDREVVRRKASRRRTARRCDLGSYNWSGRSNKYWRSPRSCEDLQVGA